MSRPKAAKATSRAQVPTVPQPEPQDGVLRVFISWSEPRSQAVANALKWWLELFFQG